MRKPPTSEEREALIAGVQPLIEAAMVISKRMIAEQEPSLADNDEAIALNATALCLQSVVLGSPFTERGQILALAIATGVLLAQQPSEQMRNLYAAWKDQCARTLAEIGASLEPKGNA